MRGLDDRPAEQEVERRLARGESGILDALGPQFERALIMRALAKTGGRRIDAANLLGMGRNTIPRKIQDSISPPRSKMLHPDSGGFPK